MEGYIGRLALNLHVLHELSVGKTLPDEEIPLSILECAIALAKFYIGQVKLIHANCSTTDGAIAPHLAKIVELSKRMDATTGISWIKAKVVQTGYDSRHRPRPNAVRSWFRELEALGLGSTRSTGIRLEYSWKLPDLPFDEERTEQQQKVEKSGEKWITSPPTETTQNQCNQEKVEKVDNPTCSLSVSLSTSDAALDNNGTESVAELETKDRRQELKDRVSDWNSYEEEETQEIKEANSRLSRVSPGTPLLSKSQSLITNPHSTYPLSGCDDDIAPEEAVDTLSTFSPPVDSVSTIPDVLDLGEVDVDLTAPAVELDLREVDVDLTAPAVELDLGEVGAGLVAPVREELQEARRDLSSTSPAAPALPQKWKIVISITVPPENFSNSDSEAYCEGEDGQCPTELTQVLLTVIEGERERSVLGGSVVFLRKVREALALRLRIALSLDNCPAHYEKGNQS
jgi:hypothetical protein